MFAGLYTAPWLGAIGGSGGTGQDSKIDCLDATLIVDSKEKNNEVSEKKRQLQRWFHEHVLEL